MNEDNLDFLDIENEEQNIDSFPRLIVNELSLGMIHPVGNEVDGIKRYELIFTDNPDEFFGEDFEYKPCSLINELLPYEKYITEKKVIKTEINFDVIQKSDSFGMQDALDGIVAIAWENIDQYDEYPEDGRLFFFFGEKLSSVAQKLTIKGIVME